MKFSYQTAQWLPRPVEEVFAFFADPENLPRLIYPGKRARIERMSLVRPSGPDGGKCRSNGAGTGSRIVLSFRPIPICPIRVSWEAEISEFTWNDHFCDRQVQGPFTSWLHCHSVRGTAGASGSDGTMVTDHVEYELPFGIIGRFARKAIVEPQLKGVFAFRQQQLARIFGASPTGSVQI